MKRFLAYIYNDLRLVLKSWPQILATYILLPLGLIAMMSFSMSMAFEAQPVEIDLEIQVDNQDQGTFGKALVETFKQKPMSDYFTIIEDANIQLVIPSQFSQDIKKIPLEIHTQGKYSQYDMAMFKSYLKTWQESMIEQTVLQDQSQNLSADQAQAFQDDIQALIQQSQAAWVQKQAIETNDSLNSIEYYLLVAILYIFIIGMSSATLFATKDEFQGLNKRLELIPLSVIDKVLYAWVSNFIQMAIFASLVLLIVCFHPEVDHSHALELVPWIFLYSGFFIGIGQTLAQTGSKVFIQIFVQLISMTFMFTTMLPLGDMIGGELGQILNQNWGKKFLINPMQDVLLGQGYSQNLFIGLTIMIFTVLLIGVNYYISKQKGAQ